MGYLHEELIVNTLKLRNRLVMAPVATEKTTGDGRVTNEHIDFYKEKSKNENIGLFIVEHSYISKEGKASPKQISVADDSDIEGLSRIAEVIHSNGAKAVLQISHAGSAASEEVTGMRAIGPSSVPNPRKGVLPEAMCHDDIKKIVDKFAKAALRVKKAGFDGVEIHSAHGYFLNQFYSPLTNKRKDEYGGSLENRIRIHLEIIGEVRKAVGEDFPVFLRLGASDFTEGGTCLEDSLIAVKFMERAGIDLIDISGGFCGYASDQLSGQGYFKGLTGPIKKAVNIPVILTGGVTSLEGAQALLKEEAADLIGVARALLKDPSWGMSS